ncbi:zinc-binding alcohol dehydrogenase family protein [Streptomyces sp. NPDC051738]|uniref:zinc-binding alcohol dehydrogenase family protein n=1 Tax=Streptomyces sp. NPDC051738 TaxID=3365672 RepID=UPI0037D8FBF8
MGVEERPVPEPTAGHFPVRVHAATANQLANSLRTATFGAPPPPPVLGNEGPGTVEASDTLPAGTRVALCGHRNLGVTAGFRQQWVSVPDSRLLPLPGGIGFDECAALAVNFLTAYLALTNAAHVQHGQTVLISGATGGLGSALIQTARALGTRPIALLSTAHKAQRALDIAAEAAIDLSARDLATAVAEATGGQEADAALDPAGGVRLGELLRAVQPRGTVVSLGCTGGKQAELGIVDLLMGEKHLHRLRRPRRTRGSDCPGAEEDR